MRSSSPTIRVAALGLLLLTLVVALVTGLYLWMLSGAQAAGLSPPAMVPRAVVLATGAWLILASGFLAGIWYVGPRVGRRLKELGHQLSEGRGEPNGMIERVRPEIGDVADALRPLASKVARLSNREAETRGHVGALLQANPHYVLLCMLDGEIVEANPAFYAVTGMSPEGLQGRPSVLLQEMFPVEPLLGLARRSARERSAISGIEYAMTDRNGVSHPVKVSLRAITIDGRDGAIIQATDVSRERSLKQKVNAFSDTLDLMVDQRVAQLTSGRSDLDDVLEAMGVAVLSFDAGGGVRRFSHATGHMLGKESSDVPHFSSLLGSLGLVDSDRAAFTRWFWGSDQAPHVTHVLRARPGEPVSVQRVVWCRAQGKESGTSDHRVLLGIPIPHAAREGISGDGQQTDHAAGPPTTAESSTPGEQFI